jgi:hypothetical protein
MNDAVEMGSGMRTHMLTFINIGSAILRLMGGYVHRHTENKAIS